MKGYSSIPRVESMALPLDQRPSPEWSCCRTDKKAGVRYWWRLVRHGFAKLPKEAMVPTDTWVPAADKPSENEFDLKEPHMAKVEVRKARKDYPNSGIKAGDTYYYTKLKLQRGGQIKRSLTPFKPSQLTNSPFKSGWLAVQEDWEDSDKDAEAIRAAAEALTSLGEEARGSFDNMPEGLQQGETGQQLEARADACENTASELESLADEFEALEEPGEEPVPDTPTDEDDEDDESFQEALDDWQTAKDEYEAEVERIADEADTLIGDMPE